MSNLDERIRDRVEAFIGEIIELVKAEALETVAAALRGEESASDQAAPARRAAPAPSAPTRSVSAGPGGRRIVAPAVRNKGQKRTADELDDLVESLFRAVRREPGLRIEEIAALLGTSTKELALPAKKLLSEGRIRTEGQKRSTKYFPA
jgi:hypothetical protein